MSLSNHILLTIAVIASIAISSVNGFVDKCSDISYQYPYFSMLPIFVGKSYIQNNHTYVLSGIKGNCFTDIKISTTFTFLNSEKDKVRADITISLENPVFLLCTEHFLIGTTFKDYYEYYFFQGFKTVSLEFTETNHFIDLLANGLKFFSFCADQTTILSSTLQTKNLFVGGLGSNKYIPFVGSKIPEYQLWSNVDFLAKYMKFPFEKRVITDVDIDKKLISSGDLLLIRRFDGIDPIIMVATGSHVGHAAVALWEDNELWILES
jgi:hypothetical protein